VHSQCICCQRKQHKEWNNNNKEKVAKKRKELYEGDKERYKEEGRIYREENADKIAERRADPDYKKAMKAYDIKRNKTPERIAQRKKNQADWFQANKQRQNKYFREKYETDLLFKLSTLIHRSSGRITQAVKDGTTKRQTSLKYLGCSLEKYQAHIESQWEEGMCWENHKLFGWHIDHITPVDWFIKNSNDPWEANHYTNLRPLWAEDNHSKGNKII
jgi:hypothetical protein